MISSLMKQLRPLPLFDECLTLVIPYSYEYRHYFVRDECYKRKEGKYTQFLTNERGSNRVNIESMVVTRRRMIIFYKLLPC